MNVSEISVSAVVRDAVAVTSAAVTIVGILTADFSSGPLHEIGHLASFVAPALAAAFAIATKVEQVIDVVSPSQEPPTA